jgi:ketosteroid isomerase-like protein
MIYRYFVKKLALQSFVRVQNHHYEAVLKAVVPNVTHHFAGDHALGGTRHDTEALLRWFERLGRVMPRLQFEIKHIWVKGMPWNTTVIVQWVATTALQNGDLYVNPGVHIITLRWGKVYSLHPNKAKWCQTETHIAYYHQSQHRPFHQSQLVRS